MADRKVRVRFAPSPTGSRTQEAHHRNAEIIEEYVNTDTGEARRFYQPLLLSFNGQKVEA